MSTKRAITLIVPTINRSDLIMRALKSLQLQTCSQFEVLVVDDSQDHATQEIVEDLNDDRFRYHRPPQCEGFYGTCKTALSMCDTPFVGFMGDDDEVSPNYLDCLYNGLQRPHTVAAYARSPWAFAGQPPFRVSKHEPIIDGGGPWGFLAHLRQPPDERFARFWGLTRRDLMTNALNLRYLSDEGGKPTLGRDFLILFYLCLQGRIFYTDETEYRFLSHDRQVGRDRGKSRFGVFPQRRFSLEDNLVGYAYMVDRILEELDNELPDFPLADKILFSYTIWEWYAAHAKGLLAQSMRTHAKAIEGLGLNDIAAGIHQHSDALFKTPLLRLNVDRPPYYPALEATE